MDLFFGLVALFLLYSLPVLMPSHQEVKVWPCSAQLLFLFFKDLFIYVFFWLHWVFVAVHGLSLAAASRATLCCGTWASHWWLLLLWSPGSRCTGFSSCGVWAQ